MTISSNSPCRLIKYWLVVSICALLFMSSINSAHAATWYVQASAKSGGNGSNAKPFNSLQQAEASSGAGDTIFVKHTPAGIMLDGQIILKPDQKLIGLGPEVRTIPDAAAAARITYSGGGGEGYPEGAVVQLSTGNEIANIHFKNMSYGAIVAIGVDFSGANIHDNLFSGGDDENGWARNSLFLRALSGDTSAIFRNNLIRDGNFLGGLVVSQRGDSNGTYYFEGNDFENIGFPAYALQSFDTATIQASIVDSSANNIGALGEYSDFANSDSIGMLLANSSRQDVVVQNYHYDNTDQVGGVSNTGLELFSPSEALGWPPFLWADGAHATLKIRDSSFSNAVTEAIQLLNTGLNSLIDVEISNTLVIDANPGQIRDISGIAGGAIAVIPQFIDGSGNQTFVKMENSDIVGSTGYAFGVYDFGVAGFGSVIDLGGGALGSVGQNRILDNVTGDIELFQSDGSGRNNWWGGDAPQISNIGGGVFDTAPELLADPRP